MTSDQPQRVPLLCQQCREEGLWAEGKVEVEWRPQGRKSFPQKTGLTLPDRRPGASVSWW